MIDYDELDERIRRIVQEEILKAGIDNRKTVESLADATAGDIYEDSYGMTWEYFSQLRWYQPQTNVIRDAEETAKYGPFKRVEYYV